MVVFLRELTDPDDPDVAAITRIYAEEYHAGPGSIDASLFAEGLRSGHFRGRPFAYHLVAVRTAPDGPVAGMASFFTFPGAGFGGYVVFSRTMRGHGYLDDYLAGVEAIMQRDGLGARGWFIECDPVDGTRPIFLRKGFHEVAITYRQPPIWAREDADGATPLLHLLYRAFGGGEPPPLRKDEVLNALRWIFGDLYRVPDVETSPFYRDIANELAALPGETVPWRG
jgi:hypothetical protein